MPGYINLIFKSFLFHSHSTAGGETQPCSLFNTGLLSDFLCEMSQLCALEFCFPRVQEISGLLFCFVFCFLFLFLFLFLFFWALYFVPFVNTRGEILVTVSWGDFCLTKDI